jgi:uncharacterized protein
MHLIQNDNNQVNLIKSINSETILIGESEFKESCIVTNQTLQHKLDLTNIIKLTSNHINQLLESNPEIIILGSGIEHVFPKIDVLQPIADKNLGFEVMNNQSAARTYNVLVAEERKVACLLII